MGGIADAAGKTVGICGALMSSWYDTLNSILKRSHDRESVMRTDAVAQFWEKKRAENQHILELMDAGTFTRSDGQALDAETLADVRQWTTQRVAECAARIAARHKYY